MDRYKFRGKPVGEDAMEMFESANEFYKDEHVYGYLVAENIIAYGVVETHDSAIVYEYWAKVDPATVGQFTGLKDKNGKEIYVGDIVKWTFEELGEDTGLIFFEEGFQVKVPRINDVESIGGFYGAADYCEILGNIHDNPELLEG